jgi:hypothetical protein
LDTTGCFLALKNRFTSLEEEKKVHLKLLVGLAIAEAVACWLPTMAVWVQVQTRSCGISVQQNGQVFCEYLNICHSTAALH